MPTPGEKLAESLTELHTLQESGRRVFRSNELSRVHRERLLRNGFVQQVMKGWLISSSPGAGDGDSTPWYTSFWEFCARYCNDRFGDDWHLAPEQSHFRSAATLSRQLGRTHASQHHPSLELAVDPSRPVSLKNYFNRM